MNFNKREFDSNLGNQDGIPIPTLKHHIENRQNLKYVNNFPNIPKYKREHIY